MYFRATATGSEVVEKLRLWLPALETLVTPAAVTVTWSPGATLIPLTIVTALDPGDTVAVRQLLFARLVSSFIV
jgi:hypothetical protein